MSFSLSLVAFLEARTISAVRSALVLPTAKAFKSLRAVVTAMITSMVSPEERPPKFRLVASAAISVPISATGLGHRKSRRGKA